jgi:hypothetical protein
LTSLQNRKTRPVPLEQYEDYGDIPPEGMDLEDVELIWWTVASRMSKKELRRRLKHVADGYRYAGCFRYAAVSDVQGRGRYPRGVINVLRQVLKPRGLMPLDTAEYVLYVQVDIWHLCISKALEWCPPNALPRKLRGIKVEADLGL